MCVCEGGVRGQRYEIMGAFGLERCVERFQGDAVEDERILG